MRKYIRKTDGDYVATATNPNQGQGQGGSGNASLMKAEHEKYTLLAQQYE